MRILFALSLLLRTVVKEVGRLGVFGGGGGGCCCCCCGLGSEICSNGGGREFTLTVTVVIFYE